MPKTNGISLPESKYKNQASRTGTPTQSQTNYLKSINTTHKDNFVFKNIKKVKL